MKPSFTDLTPLQQSNYGNGCGLNARFLRVPQFIFTASCRQHDFNYSRGGGLFDKFKADWDFFTHMVNDAQHSQHRFAYTCISIAYFLGVSLNPISYFAFTWGRWRSIEEILYNDYKRKRVV